MDYIKVFTDFVKVMEPLGDAERGRLFTAMLEYAERGTEPNFRGNERFIWPAAKLNIDRCAEEYEKMTSKNRENGKKGGRPSKKQNPVGFNENPKNPAVFLETQKSQDKDKDKDKDKEIYKKEIDKEKIKTLPRFTAPTLAEVKAYCAERNNSVDADRWLDYYTSNGWMVGKNKMRDWKAAVRTWEKNGYSNKPEKPKKETSFDMELINKRFELGNVK